VAQKILVPPTGVGPWVSAGSCVGLCWGDEKSKQFFLYSVLCIIE
jgi:hypothetical protein